MPLSVFAKNAGPPYRYNRITENLNIQKNSDVEIEELLTMFYNGSYRSMWRIIPNATTTVISNIKIFDGNTGQAFNYSPVTLDANNPSSWGKYTTYVKDGATQIEWYYNTFDHVHTWALHYLVRGGVVNFTSDHDELIWNLFSGYDVPVDTVEAEVRLPDVVTEPQVNIFTTLSHDYYIDRPDDKTFRFRVSDIAPGERVTVKVGWQKDLVHPHVSAPFLLMIATKSSLLVMLMLGLAVVVGGIYYLRKRRGISLESFKRFFVKREEL